MTSPSLNLDKKSQVITSIFNSNWKTKLLHLMDRIVYIKKIKFGVCANIIEAQIAKSENTITQSTTLNKSKLVKDSKKKTSLTKTKKVLNPTKSKLDDSKWDKTIIEELSKVITEPENMYSPEQNKKRADSKWVYINPMLANIKINGYLDYGGGNGDMAFELGSILKLNKDRIFVIDKLEFSGHIYHPRTDITFINYDNLNTAEGIIGKVQLITMFHVMHHIPEEEYPRIIKLCYDILAPDGILVLYEHNCSNDYLASIIDLEHCLFDCVISKMLTYNKFVDNFYAKYKNIHQWKLVFSKYFRIIKLIELKNMDNSFYCFFAKR